MYTLNKISDDSDMNLSGSTQSLVDYGDASYNVREETWECQDNGSGMTISQSLQVLTDYGNWQVNGWANPME